MQPKIFRILVLFLIVPVLLMGVAMVPASGENGCHLTGVYSGGPPAYVNFTTCTYTASGPGFYVGQGTPWCVTVTRGLLTPQQICSNEIFARSGQLVTQAGDVVTVEVKGGVNGCAILSGYYYCGGLVIARDNA